MTLTVNTTLVATGPATAIVLSGHEVEQLAGGKRAAVVVKINQVTQRLRLGVMGGKNLIGMSKAVRDLYQVSAGDEVTAEISLDQAPREVVVPKDLAEALEKAGLREKFDRLAYTHRKEYVRSIEESRTVPTRLRRITGCIDTLSSPLSEGSR